MKQYFDMSITCGDIQIEGPVTWEGGVDDFNELCKTTKNLLSHLCNLPGSTTMLPQLHNTKYQTEMLLQLAVAATTDPMMVGSELPMRTIIYCVLNFAPPGYPGTYGDRVGDHSFHFNVVVKGNKAKISATCLSSPSIH
jgi:hypothetical protein